MQIIRHKEHACACQEHACGPSDRGCEYACGCQDYACGTGAPTVLEMREGLDYANMWKGKEENDGSGRPDRNIRYKYALGRPAALKATKAGTRVDSTRLLNRTRIENPNLSPFGTQGH